jgi:hypothetical protein
VIPPTAVAAVATKKNLLVRLLMWAAFLVEINSRERCREPGFPAVRRYPRRSGEVKCV